MCLQSTLSAFFNAAENGHCSKLYIFHMVNLCSWHVFGPMEAAEVEMEKSIFLFSSRIQWAQNILFKHSGFMALERWQEGAKIPVTHPAAHERLVSRLNQLFKWWKSNVKCAIKTCVNVYQPCWVLLISATLNLPAENPFVLLKRSALTSLKPICSLGECRKQPFQCPCTHLRSSFSYGRYVWLYLGRMQYCAFMI